MAIIVAGQLQLTCPTLALFERLVSHIGDGGLPGIVLAAQDEPTLTITVNVNTEAPDPPE